MTKVLRNNFQIIFSVFAVTMACSPATEKELTTTSESYYTTNDPAADFKKMSWLAASWKGMYKGEPFYEAWRMTNDSVIANYGIQIKGSDTIVERSGTIHLRNREVFYGTDSVYWKLATLTESELVFKNDTLPYSRTILWKHAPEDHWYTKLSHPNGSVSEYDLIKQPQLDNAVTKFINDNPNQ